MSQSLWRASAGSALFLLFACSDAPIDAVNGFQYGAGVGATTPTGTAGVTSAASGGKSGVSAGTGVLPPVAGTSAVSGRSGSSGGSAGTSVVATAGTGVGISGNGEVSSGEDAGISIDAGVDSGSIATGGMSGGDETSAGSSAGTVAAGSGSTTDDGRPPCKGKPSEVVIIGDSYINWISHTLPADLAKEAGETWRLYAVGGASMLAGGIAELIPAQFEDAVKADPDILAVVMDGGGNDVLISDQTKYPGSANCKSAGSSKLAVCTQIVKDTIVTFQKLQDRMVMAGVKDIVYFFYPDVPLNTPIGGSDPNEISDYAKPFWQMACDGAEQRTGGKIRCHFVDMVPVFAGHPDYFAAADIHPNPSGSAAMAKAIVGKMKADCVWQDASSGCCAPH